MEHKINLIYVLSSGHSSSTLINLISGISKNTFSIGELKVYENFIHKRKLGTQKKNLNFLCDCQKDLKSCEFWSPITKKINSNKLFSRQPTLNQRLQLFFYLFFKTPRIHKENSEDEKLFKEILQQARKIKGEEIEYIIDSSKDLNRLMYLSQNKYLDIRVIHLIRDGRAVINSHEKQGYFWIRTLLEWFSLNLSSKIFLKLHNIKHYNLSYDKFAQNPEFYINELNKEFGLHINPNTFLEDIQNEEWHNFAGNSARWTKFTQIKYDQSWKKRMPKWKQYLLTILCYLPNKFFGVYK